MKATLTVLAMLSVLYGCAGNKPLQQQAAAEPEPAPPPERQAQARATTAESYRWRVYCKHNSFRGYQECNMRAGGAPSKDGLGSGEPISLLWISWYSSLPDSYYVHIPHNDYRDFDPTLQVDSLQPVSYKGEGAMFTLQDKLVEQMRAGRFLYVTYYKWPYGKTRLVIDLNGFTAAHARLQQEVQKHR
jgi:invasion protein IalB